MVIGKLGKRKEEKGKEFPMTIDFFLFFHQRNLVGFDQRFNFISNFQVE